VLSKLVIAAVLALAAGLLGSSSGVGGVVEGVGLLAVASFAPFALLRLVPAVEAGATAHLEGLGRRPLHAAERLGKGNLGTELGAVAGLGALGRAGAADAPADGADSQGAGEAFSGPWTADRAVSGATPHGHGQGDPGAPDANAPSGPHSSPAPAVPGEPSSSVASAARPAENFSSSAPSATSAYSFPTAGVAGSTGVPGRAEGPIEESYEVAVARWAQVLAEGDREHG
jgi:hypothetical protein